MGQLGEQLTTVALGIVGVAIIAVLVSQRANTANVINAAGSAFAGALSTAVSPVTGFTGGASPLTGLQPGFQQGFYNAATNFQNYGMH